MFAFIFRYQLQACLLSWVSYYLNSKYHSFEVSHCNMHRIVVLIACLYVFNIINGCFAAAKLQDDPGEPLFLTPYLDAGKIDEARRLRLVFGH